MSVSEASTGGQRVTKYRVLAKYEVGVAVEVEAPTEELAKVAGQYAAQQYLDSVENVYVKQYDIAAEIVEAFREGLDPADVEVTYDGINEPQITAWAGEEVEA
jgi:hypothetical protein